MHTHLTVQTVRWLRLTLTHWSALNWWTLEIHSSLCAERNTGSLVPSDELHSGKSAVSSSAEISVSSESVCMLNLLGVRIFYHRIRLTWSLNQKKFVFILDCEKKLHDSFLWSGISTCITCSAASLKSYCHQQVHVHYWIVVPWSLL